MVTNKENLFKLGKKITDRIPQQLGIAKITEEDPEYWGMVNVLTDEMVEVALKMKKRVPISLDELAKATGKDRDHLREVLQEMAVVGLIEFHWGEKGLPMTEENKRYVLCMYVPGSAEMLLMHKTIPETNPEVNRFFERMSFLPLEHVTPMVPPGGAGIGMHVIPVEKAIPAQSQSLDIERLSHWLDKYEGHLGVGVCSCRRSETLQGRGSGDVPDEWCIGVGEFADYCVQTGKGRYATKEEVLAVLQRAEDLGYVHQITNIDGENKIFGICNCPTGVCYALRTSQYFNTPNLSRSAYVAHVDTENCVACGKCVEVCPAGAAKLGQKLCTKSGPIQYPKHELPDAVKWGPEKWSPNYKEDNEINCYDTGTSPCKTACPAHIAVQGYIKMAAQGRYMDALKLIKQDNPFPAVCGSICNRRCEEECTRGDVDRAVAIDEIKKFIAEQELKEENRYIPPIKNFRPTLEKFPEKIAIIGAGPAGMSCAYYLAMMGYENVTVFDRNAVPGGMLTLGIPSFRLEKDVVNAEIEVLRRMGVEFKCGVDVGKDVTLAQLREQGYKAFYLAIGAQKSAHLGVPGEELEGVLGGVDFLRRVNLGEKPAIGEKCAVIGGGNVAMDVCRTALRLGAKDTYVLYRRSQSEMPADEEELAEAMEEGVQFRFLTNIVEIIGSEGKVSAVKVELMELGEAGPDGRRKPIGTGKFETIAVDSVIGAVGQLVDLGGIAPEAMSFTKKGTVVVDEVTAQTAQKDIFAGGDFVTGPKFAIDAIAAGRVGAESIHRFVQPGQDLRIHRNLRKFVQLDKTQALIPIGFDNAPRQVPAHDKTKAKSFSNDRVTFTEEQVRKEASRCLGCGATVVDENKCIGCGLCTTKCEFDAIHLRRDLPECSNMYKAEDKLKAILPYAAKREVRIIKNKKK
ncbi:MAG TPA: FAD-dependent oxidoreductase [Candidatus Limivicinus faecipullorum]|nr:FAD-dependent oxidoreductase [Candidatus Limivicinus faecipullorum]